MGHQPRGATLDGTPRAGMIAVLCDESQRDAACEFFQLLKTPWEFAIPGRRYQVAISTGHRAPSVDAKLVLIFSSSRTQFDEREAISVEAIEPPGAVSQRGVVLPIYGGLARLCGRGAPLLVTHRQSEVVGLVLSEPERTIHRIGYDLFAEVTILLSAGQPAEYASSPTLEIHISWLRSWITAAGIALVEIPPIPQGYRLIGCLTHDVDFAGIRYHGLDHTVIGFVYRALVGSALALVRRRTSIARMLKNWLAVVTLPLVHLGLIRDPWNEFARYVKLDGRHSSTFFIIPLKNAPGSDVRTRFAGRRAARYDVGDVRAEVTALVSQGFEVGVHGIDAWRDAEAGRLELRRIAEATQEVELGIRVHWLCYDTRSPGILEEAGYDYDSTLGFNETVGYRAGTLQAFRPLGVRALLELPLHLQDTAMFLRHGLGLSEAQAWGRCMQVLDAAEEYGGVVTILWHMRSLSPERLWGGFYARLIEELQARGAWCTSARQAVRWFRQRRSVVFEEVTVEGNALRLRLSHDIRPDGPGMFLRVHRPPRNRVATVIGGPTHIDVPWTGESHVKIDLEE